MNEAIMEFSAKLSSFHYITFFAVVILLHILSVSDIREGMDNIRDLLSQPKYTYEKESLLQDIDSQYHDAKFGKWFRLRMQYAIAVFCPVILIAIMSSAESPLSYVVLVPTVFAVRCPSSLGFSWILVLVSVFTSPFTVVSLIALALFIPLFATIYVREIPYIIQRVYLFLRNAKDSGSPSDYYNDDHH